MTPFEVPLAPPQPQRFNIELAGQTRQLTLVWNIPAACWLMNIADQNGDTIVNGLPLITGADLLEQFEYLLFGGNFVAQTDSMADEVPTFDNLGETGRLYFVTP